MALAALLAPLASADPLVYDSGPLGHGVGQGPIPLATPGATVPATCTVGPCQEETVTPTVSHTTPGVAPRTITTDPVPIPGFCLPPDASNPYLCSSGTEVHSQSVGPTPAVQPQTVTVPSRTVPAVCDATGQVCVGPFTIQSVPLGTTPAVAVAFDTPGLVASADAHEGETIVVGPIVVVDIPDNQLIGPEQVTVCTQTCDVQRPPSGNIDWTVTVTYQVGDLSDSVTVPIQHALPEA